MIESEVTSINQANANSVPTGTLVIETGFHTVKVPVCGAYKISVIPNSPTSLKPENPIQKKRMEAMEKKKKAQAQRQLLVAQRRQEKLKRIELLAQKKEAYAPILEVLASEGYKNANLNFKLLMQHDGDTEKVKKGVEEVRRQRREAKLKEQGKYTASLETLASEGFKNVNLNTKLLIQHNGDIEKVKEGVKEVRRQRREAKLKEQGKDAVENEVPLRGQKEASRMAKIQEGKRKQVVQQQSQFGTALDTLASQGFKNQNLNMRLLKKHQGDVEKVKTDVTEIRKQRQAEKKLSVLREQLKNQEHALTLLKSEV